MKKQSDDIEVYKLSEDQKNVVNEARQQIKNGQFLTDNEADKDINDGYQIAEKNCKSTSQTKSYEKR